MSKKLDAINAKLEAARKRTQELRDQLKAQEEFNKDIRMKLDNVKKQIEMSK